MNIFSCKSSTFAVSETWNSLEEIIANKDCKEAVRIEAVAELIEEASV